MQLSDFDDRLEQQIADEMTHLEAHPSPDSFGVRGIQLAGLWDAHNPIAWGFYSKIIEMKEVDREKAIAMSRFFDLQLLYKWNDQRSKIEPDLEPIDSVKAYNKILQDGLSRLMLFCANKSSEFFYWVASGTGTSAPTVGQKALDNENARVDMRVDGHLDSIGNILFFRARFSEGISSDTVYEFAACDSADDPAKFCWRVVLPEANKIEHVQYDTWYTASHYLIATAK